MGLMDKFFGDGKGLRSPGSMKHGGKRVSEILAAHAKFYAGEGGAQANLEGADLANADFRGVNLSNANLTGAKLDGANFRKAKLVRVNMATRQFAWNGFAQCRFDGSEA